MKKILLATILCAGLMTFALPLQAAPNCQKTHHYFPDSKKADDVFALFQNMGQGQIANDATLQQCFSDNFKMIINGKTVVDGLVNLKPHFEAILSKVGSINYTLHEKIFSKGKVVLRYDTESPKGQSHVIAILKFHQGKVYEINKVVKVTRLTPPTAQPMPAAK